ncbi:hypothetical protein AVEN_238190-1 [Araneus ventricosus]|uniref:Uncharacterized protein n=1 Tax=Araneus ventricosus TaxID=182803 RepID=A0A4Y2VS95_ARAVE|nr:hypothetical protein AVEN_238190-1 [Araneus ventricosus]
MTLGRPFWSYENFEQNPSDSVDTDFAPTSKKNGAENAHGSRKDQAELRPFTALIIKWAHLSKRMALDIFRPLPVCDKEQSGMNHEATGCTPADMLFLIEHCDCHGGNHLLDDPSDTYLANEYLNSEEGKFGKRTCVCQSLVQWPVSR